MALFTSSPGKTHNDRDALCIWLRDVPGSVGDNATAYSTGGAAISGTVVRIPPMIRSTSGVASTAVRMRGYSPAGVAHSTANNTVSTSKIHFKGIWFDGTSSRQTTSDGFVVAWGGSTTGTLPAITMGATAEFTILEDCYSDSHSATATFKALSATRVQYIYRCNINNNATDMLAQARNLSAPGPCGALEPA